IGDLRSGRVAGSGDPATARRGFEDSAPATPPGRGSLQNVLTNWQFDREAAALADCTVHVDRTAEELDVALGDGQSQARMHAVCLPRWVGAVKALENVLAGLWRDADTGVRDLQEQ